MCTAREREGSRESRVFCMTQRACLVRPVIAESTKHYGRSAHSHLQTKRPAGATNERIPKSLHIKEGFIKVTTKGSATL